MNQKQFEQQIKNKLSPHQVVVDTDELWQTIEPTLPKEDKRKVIGLWFLLAIGLAAPLVAGFCYWGNQTAPVAQLANAREDFNENKLSTNQELVEKLNPKEKLAHIVQTKKETASPIAKTDYKKLVSKIQQIEGNPIVKTAQLDSKLTTRLNNKAITKTTPSISTTKNRAVTILNSLPVRLPYLAFLEDYLMEKRAEETPIKEDQKKRKDWNTFIAINGGGSLVSRTIETNPTTNISEARLDNYISRRESTETQKTSPVFAVSIGKEHKKLGISFKTGLRYTQVKSVFETDTYSSTTLWNEDGLSEIQINPQGDSTFIYDGNWVLEEKTQHVKHYNQFHVLDIPLLVGKSFSVNDEIRFGVEAGLAWNILFRPKGRMLNLEEDVIYFEESDYKTSVGASFIGGIHWTYAFSPGMEVKVALQYQKYLGSWMEKSAPTKENYQVIGLQLGVVKRF